LVDDLASCSMSPWVRGLRFHRRQSVPLASTWSGSPAAQGWGPCQLLDVAPGAAAPGSAGGDRRRWPAPDQDPQQHLVDDLASCSMSLRAPRSSDLPAAIGASGQQLVRIRSGTWSTTWPAARCRPGRRVPRICRQRSAPLASSWSGSAAAPGRRPGQLLDVAPGAAFPGSAGSDRRRWPAAGQDPLQHLVEDLASCSMSPRALRPPDLPAVIGTP
jgi:hypothetical protein